MPDIQLTYFDFHGGRGEAARLALAIGGIPFDDRRIPLAEWPAVQPEMPFHAVPVLTVDGKSVTQSNGINRYVGKLTGLYPGDPWQAARCDEVMGAVEDVITKVVATFGMTGDELAAARGNLVEGPLTFFLERIQGLLEEAGGTYFVGDALSVADLKVLVWIRSLRAGILDHVPVDLVDRVAPALAAHADRIAAHPAIVAYYADR